MIRAQKMLVMGVVGSETDVVTRKWGIIQIRLEDLVDVDAAGRNLILLLLFFFFFAFLLASRSTVSFWVLVLLVLFFFFVSFSLRGFGFGVVCFFPGEKPRVDQVGKHWDRITVPDL